MLETNNHTNAWQGFKTGRWNKNIDVRIHTIELFII